MHYRDNIFLTFNHRGHRHNKLIKYRTFLRHGLNFEPDTGIITKNNQPTTILGSRFIERS